jgi:hypothetical protein
MLSDMTPLRLCALGAPDQHSTFGTTDILTYYATSTGSDASSIPLTGGFPFANGAYRHATFQLIEGHVTQLLYSGEKNAAFAPDTYCVPVRRICRRGRRRRLCQK